jgi:RNase P subunit RPR2
VAAECRRPGSTHPAEEETMAVNGYCLKCKTSVEIKDAQAITMKNGKPATKGTCPTCGTTIFKIGKAA